MGAAANEVQEEAKEMREEEEERMHQPLQLPNQPTV